MDLTVEVKLVSETCCACGVTFAMPEELQHKRRKDHKNFYCPNGHSLHFPGETEEERLRKKLAQAEIDATRAQQALEAAWAAEQRALDEAKKAKAAQSRQAKRVKEGVCPCCNRTFKQLAAHMKNKHPHYLEKEPA